METRIEDSTAPIPLQPASVAVPISDWIGRYVYAQETMRDYASRMNGTSLMVVPDAFGFLLWIRADQFAMDDAVRPAPPLDASPLSPPPAAAQVPVTRATENGTLITTTQWQGMKNSQPTFPLVRGAGRTATK